MGWTRNIRIRQLRMLLRLVEIKNISQVADEFNLTQPALSKWLKEFENTLGAELFKRQARGLLPLPLSLELASQARSILARLDRLQRSIDQIKNTAHTQLAIGISPIIAHSSFADTIVNFHQQNPLVFMQIQENSTDKLIDQLRSGEIDLAIARTEKSASFSDLEQQHLIDLSLCLAVGENHPLLQQEEVSWQEAMQYPWITPPSTSPARQKIDLVFEELQIASPPLLIESNTLSLNAQILKKTHLIAPVASLAMESLGLKHFLATPQIEERFNASLSVLWSAHNERIQLIEQFLDCIQTHFE